MNFRAKRRYKALAVGFILLCWLYSPFVIAGPPYLTGVIEDGGSQTIEMPSLPYSFLRQIAWLAPEGSRVSANEVVVRVQPGNLLEQEEILAAAYEENVVAADTQIAEHQLSVIDAETAVAAALTARDLARLDAAIPASAVTQLNYDKAQLALENAENALRVADGNLVNAHERIAKLRPVLELRVTTAKTAWDRVRNALAELELRADREGIVMYAEHMYNGTRIYDGETLMQGHPIVTIATRERLQFVFWAHDADINRIREGLRLMVIADGLPDIEVEATVDWVASYATEREFWSDSGYFKLIASPTKPLPDALIPGMAVSAEVL